MLVQAGASQVSAAAARRCLRVPNHALPLALTALPRGLALGPRLGVIQSPAPGQAELDRGEREREREAGRGGHIVPPRSALAHSPGQP